MTNRLAKPSTPEPSQLRLKYGAEASDLALIIPQTLEDDEILELGRQVRSIANASSWWLADYILFCQKAFLESRKHRREVYDKISKLWPEYARSTLKEYASIARRVPPEIRSASLSFDHHAHIATLSDEPQARELQKHYIKAATDTEATAEQLRLMIADTRHGIRLDQPRNAPRSPTIDLNGSDHTETTLDLRKPSQRPISEPELLGGGHAQLASEAQRACSRLREWYANQARKASIETWPNDRKSVLIHDLEPLTREMHAIADVVGQLTGQEAGV